MACPVPRPLSWQDTQFTPKTCRTHQIQPEHLKYGGAALSFWISQVANELESVPQSLKLGIVTPLYKGSGKDPLDTNSYRGITVLPALARVLESLIHGRLSDVLAESGLPHINQTAYQKNMSCAEAIFSTLEIVSNYCKKGDRMYYIPALSLS